MQDYRKLVVWGDAHALTLEIYRTTASFPDVEKFGLTSQMRRAAASIPANLAEGAGRSSSGDFARFVSMALGSLQELDYWLLLARDLRYLSCTRHHQIHCSVGRLKKRLNRLYSKLRSSAAARD